MLSQKEGPNYHKVFRSRQQTETDADGNKTYTPIPGSFSWTCWMMKDLLPYDCESFTGLQTPTGHVLNNMRIYKDVPTQDV